MSMLAMLTLSLATLPHAPLSHASLPIAPAASVALTCDDSTNRSPDCASPLRGASGKGTRAETGRTRYTDQARAKPCNSDALKGLACRHDNMRFHMENQSEALAAR